MSPSRKADQVADDILRGIVSGEISVGSLLPKEVELAEQYGVNRSVVREAIKLLEVHGLVQPRRRRGTEVLDPMASLSPEVMERMLIPAPGQVDPKALAEFLEVRASLDRQMSVLAAERRTEADLDALDACVEALQGAVDDPQAYDHGVDHFALLVARASHNRLFEMLVHWNQRVARELSDVFRVARPIGAPHALGLGLITQMIREQRAEELGPLVSAYHAWAIPRLMAAAALRGGSPLSSIAVPASEE